jgi:hypothetical protein
MISDGVLERLTVQITGDLDGLNDAADRVNGTVRRMTSDIEGSTGKINGSLGKIGPLVSGAVGGFVAGFAMEGVQALGGFAKKAIETTSDVQELRAAVGENFGTLTSDIESWAEATGNAMGRSTQEMLKGANAFQMFFKQAAPTNEAATEMSKNFAALAQDLSSFYNIDPSEALQKLQSGLSGESEPLRALGVFLNEGAVAAKALEMGLAGSAKELTDQDKILARYNLILEQTKTAQGDVARTSDSFANQQRRLGAAVDELTVKFGTAMMPAITAIVTGLADMLSGSGGVADGLSATLGPSVAAIGRALSGLASGPIGQILFPALRALAGYIGDVMIFSFKSWSGVLVNVITGLDNAARATVGFLRAVTVMVSSVIESVQRLPSEFVRIGGQIVAGLVAGITGGVQAAANAAARLAQQTAQAAKDALGIKSPSRVFMNYGEMIGEGLAIGIRAKSGDVAGAVESLANIAAQLFPKSFGSGSKGGKILGALGSLAGIFSGGGFGSTPSFKTPGFGGASAGTMTLNNYLGNELLDSRTLKLSSGAAVQSFQASRAQVPVDMGRANRNRIW